MIMEVPETQTVRQTKLKKSRQESDGEGCGVEIITNEPYTDGPGGSGQYTFKIYHIGNKIPAWLRSVLPSAALEAHEEAWNAYPYTKTRYSCPLMERFSVEVETKYYNDAGIQDNVFELTDEDLKNRAVDVMDFVNDSVSSFDYLAEEDPKLYVSSKTGRGPLHEDWVDDCSKNGKPIMCAYKLCKVELRYWGLQTRAERWIQNFALRNTMLRAHRQAWAWQDEWYGLSIEDVRHLEQQHLSRVMARSSSPISKSSSIYFDCTEGPLSNSQKNSMIRWSSELVLTEHETPPPTPRTDKSQLLIFIFHGDVFPEAPAEQKLTDANSLRTAIEAAITSHYIHLRSCVHFLQISCGRELGENVAHLTTIMPSLGVFHPSLSVLLTSSSQFNEAVRNTLMHANDAYKQFIQSADGQNFNGEIYAIGDFLGGLILHECLKKVDINHRMVSRHSSSISANSHLVQTDSEMEVWPIANMPIVADEHALSINHSTSSNRQKSLGPSESQQDGNSQLMFHINISFLLGSPLAIVLAQRQLYGYEPDILDCDQLFNLYYPLDPCGARIEPVLNPQLAILQPVNVLHIPDRTHIEPISCSDYGDSVLDSSLLWGTRRIDHILYCPNSMSVVPYSALPGILHASYWESDDVAYFVLRQFIRTGETSPLAVGSSYPSIPFEIDVGLTSWSRRRTKYKIANLASSHRGNDVIVLEGNEQIIHARFCYGPMDLVALSRENVSAYVRSLNGDWQLIGTELTDSHGRIIFSLGKRLPIGIHCVKLIVHGDHSFLDLFVVVAPPGERCVVFSIDGSLTGSVSVTGRDPRVRPGAVDVVRFWQDLGYTIIYLTARPDMQQKVVATWLALHNFPQGLLIFAPSFSTDPLRQKTMHLRNMIEMGIRITAAYGSAKDVTVYSAAGIGSDRIFAVGAGRRRGCAHIDSYTAHLAELSAGTIECAQPFRSAVTRVPSITHGAKGRCFVQRSHSFAPRSGKHARKAAMKAK